MNYNLGKKVCAIVAMKIEKMPTYGDVRITIAKPSPGEPREMRKMSVSMNIIKNAFISFALQQLLTPVKELAYGI